MNPDPNKSIAATLAIGFLMAVAAVPSVHADLPAPDTFLVPAGTTAHATAVSATHIRIEGTLVRDTPGNLVLKASDLTVTAGGIVRGYDGARGSSVIGVTVVGWAGQDGGSLVIQAATVIVQKGAQLQSGSGGAGGAAAALDSAQGARGGNGGNIAIEASNLTVNGLLLPGAGGAGGTAIQHADHAGRVVAGNGGNSGLVYVNGAPWAGSIPSLPAPDTTRPSMQRTEFNPDPALKDQKLDLSYLANGGGQPIFTTKMPPEPNTPQFKMLLQLNELLAWTTPIQNKIPSTDASPYLKTSGGLGTPGSPGESNHIDCYNPQGSSASPNALGDGADGGNACADLSGGAGGAGGDGQSGAFSCSPGGAGGTGGTAAGGTAKGGDGGVGKNHGGRGGTATANAQGGNGGSGGEGGSPYLLPGGCPGGIGGNGGNGTGGTATGGNGGTGGCRGGAEGSAYAMGRGGGGGGGGAGWPAGKAGDAGTAAQGAAAQGTAGASGNVC
jgi:hypothetical protein